MTIFAGIGLDELVRVEDALDAIIDGRTARQEYIECNKSQVQPLYATAWDCAQEFIQSFGTARKALNQVQKAIQAQ